METKELQLLGSIPMTKQAQADFVAGMVEAATNGEHSPLKIIAQAKSMAAMLKAFIDDESVKNAVLNEFAAFAVAELTGKLI